MKKSISIAVIVIVIVALFIFIRSQKGTDFVAGDIRVISPNGGETLKKGESRDLLWSVSSEIPSNMGTVYIQSSVTSRSPDIIAQNINLNSGGFGWKAGDILRGSKIILGALLPGEYKIKVCNNTSNVCGISDGYFSLRD